MKRGIKESMNLGDVVSFSNEEELNVWADEPPTCNKLSGTDATIFSTFRRPEEGVTVFSAELCRSLVLNFESKGKYNGVPVSKFSTDFGDIKVGILYAKLCSQIVDRNQLTKAFLVSNSKSSSGFVFYLFNIQIQAEEALRF